MTEPSSGAGIDRRSALLLIAAVLLGLIVSLVLRAQAPVGENVGDRRVVEEIRADATSPASRNPGADVTIITYTDYQCPACRRAHPELVRAVEEDGRTRLVFRDWPIFGPLSERAARVALASDYQGIYPRLHDRLMQARDFSEAGLRREVERAGGDWERLLDDLSTHRAGIEERIASNRQQAFALDLPGTPGYLVGPFLIRGAATESEFRKAIAQAREARS